jgi:hypothetical protein
MISHAGNVSNQIHLIERDSRKPAVLATPGRRHLSSEAHQKIEWHHHDSPLPGARRPPRYRLL